MNTLSPLSLFMAYTFLLFCWISAKAHQNSRGERSADSKRKCWSRSELKISWSCLCCNAFALSANRQRAGWVYEMLAFKFKISISKCISRAELNFCEEARPKWSEQKNQLQSQRQCQIHKILAHSLLLPAAQLTESSSYGRRLSRWKKRG